MSRRRKLEVIQNAEYVTIGELVQLSGVRYSTLKFYTEEGLLPFYQMDQKMVRRYHRTGALQRLAQIQKLKQEQGLTIKEIKEKLLEDD
ncbi:helix-turn-helix domain-containing protein [Thermoflavimicrobium daqui]|jgi:DNA-binding transcriptional MerR regulator|uniref:MerR family DNA-binding transcriptional regulator n=1 Tax=Thermoflavimicrobium daqui TaxID=2137476 RepID=A0A364K115_9BACL|nr:helix-turn-helix domain-containing protein [Thermoflavimicrobium daqui]RAL21305.1 MerR family DNA-binding transcriptional regulator [Thermoflavimicrobium daqui]